MLLNRWESRRGTVAVGDFRSLSNFLAQYQKEGTCQTYVQIDERVSNTLELFLDRVKHLIGQGADRYDEIEGEINQFFREVPGIRKVLISIWKHYGGEEFRGCLETVIDKLLIG